MFEDYIEYKVIKKKCETCHGSGHYDYTDMTCDNCNGTGSILVVRIPKGDLRIKECRTI